MTAAIWNSPERLLALDTAARSQDLSRVVVTDGAGVRYFTGFTGSSGYLLHSPAGVPTLITDFRYEEQAAAEAASGINVHVANEGWVSGLADILGAARGERIGFDPEHLMVSDLERLEERLPDVEFVSVRGLGTRLRARKDDKEIAAIERAARIAEAALEDVLVSVDWHDGPTELDVAVALEMALRVAGSTGLPFDVIVASGERTSRPHATPSTGRVEAGDLVLLDFGAIASGYCSDITRTFVVGPPHPWQKDIHARVLEAQALAIAAVAPGVRAVDVDAAARDHFASHDLDQYFGHSTGHGIGLEVHEGPRVSSRSEDVLEPGNVVTVEPGVYLPGRGGVRIEDDVAVTETGSRVLTLASRELIEL